MTPENAKRLLLALQDNIRKFEQDNGSIVLPQGGVGGGNVFPMDLEPKGQA